MTKITDTPSNILYRVCQQLQRRDKNRGFSKDFYTTCYNALTTPKTRPPMTLTEVLDDAYNCNLITDAEYDYVLNNLNPTTP